MASSAGEFRLICDEFLASPNSSKKELARILGLEPSYFSKLYNGKKNVSSYLIERLKQYLRRPKDTLLDRMGNVQPNDRLYQLTVQVQMLTEQIGRLKERVDKLESDEKKANASRQNLSKRRTA